MSSEDWPLKRNVQEFYRTSPCLTKAYVHGSAPTEIMLTIAPESSTRLRQRRTPPSPRDHPYRTPANSIRNFTLCHEISALPRTRLGDRFTLALVFNDSTLGDRGATDSDFPSPLPSPSLFQTRLQPRVLLGCSLCRLPFTTTFTNDTSNLAFAHATAEAQLSDSRFWVAWGHSGGVPCTGCVSSCGGELT